MKILRADVMGACFGVERALRILFKELDMQKDGDLPIYTYGHLVHNKQILKKIENLGVKSIEEPVSEKGTLVVRAHGIDALHCTRFKDAGFSIVDATCPIVKQNFIAMSKEKNHILYIGEKGHSETEGYKNSTKAPFFIVDSVEAVSKLDKNVNYSVFFQTTFGSALGYEIKQEIEKQGLKVTYKSSICKASTERRAAVDKLAKKVKVIAVIGDKASSNSNALYKRVENHGCIPYLIENEDDIKAFPYKDAEEIGLTAAASVTKEMIEDYEKLLLEL